MDILISSLFLEKFIIYSSALLFCIVVIYFYLRKQKKQSRKFEAKIQNAIAKTMEERIPSASREHYHAV